MFTTTLAAIALAGGISSGVIPSTPNWHTDYAQAMSRSSAEGKPMAVFIGNGADRVAKMLSDGTISADAARVLNASYVCVYLDANTESGKDLAGRFEITEGLVISSKGGNLQAYRHAGAIKGKDLTDSLGKYADSATPVSTSSNIPYSKTGSVVVGGYPSTYAPARATTQYVYPSSGYTYPNYTYPQYGTYPAQNCTGFK
jgi:hypothetical protein